MVFAAVKRFCKLFYTGKINLAGRQISKAQSMTVARIIIVSTVIKMSEREKYSISYSESKAQFMTVVSIYHFTDSEFSKNYPQKSRCHSHRSALLIEDDWEFLILARQLNHLLSSKLASYHM